MKVRGRALAVVICVFAGLGIVYALMHMGQGELIPKRNLVFSKESVNLHVENFLEDPSPQVIKEAELYSELLGDEYVLDSDLNVTSKGKNYMSDTIVGALQEYLDQCPLLGGRRLNVDYITRRINCCLSLSKVPLYL